jgi:hypothetical protein
MNLGSKNSGYRPIIQDRNPFNGDVATGVNNGTNKALLP